MVESAGAAYIALRQILGHANFTRALQQIQNPDGSPGLFGPPVPVPDSAPLLDRLIGLTGRDPAWQPGSEN